MEGIHVVVTYTYVAEVLEELRVRPLSVSFNWKNSNPYVNGRTYLYLHVDHRNNG